MQRPGIEGQEATLLSRDSELAACADLIATDAGIGTWIGA